MKEFFLASGNSHKAEEFNLFFKNSSIRIISPSEKIDVIEDGKSYMENALLKAKAYYEKLKRPVMSDDSGLGLEAFPDIMGIHSARFGGDGLTDHQRCLKLLETLGDIENRNASFFCVLCFYLSPDEIYFFEGKVDGFIGKRAQGEQGFGYDPIFHPKKFEEKTLAEIPDWKRENSHRAMACGLAKKFF